MDSTSTPQGATVAAIAAEMWSISVYPLIQRVAVHGRSHGLTSLRIDVHADNLPAVRAYEMLGFQV